MSDTVSLEIFVVKYVLGMIVPVWNLMMSDSVVILFMAFCDMLILLSVFAVNAVCVLRKSILEKKIRRRCFLASYVVIIILRVSIQEVFLHGWLRLCGRRSWCILPQGRPCC